MKLYYSPGACSLGIHFLIEEIGAPYEAVAIPLNEGAQFRDDYVAINPKSKVPLLQRNDGSFLTEFGAIAHWLVHSHGDGRFAPASLEEEVRTVEIIDYIVSTVHMQGFSRVLRPQKYSPSEADLGEVRTTGRGIVTKGLKILSDTLWEKDFMVGDRLGAADCAMFYILFWATQRIGLKLPGRLPHYHAELTSRPAARAVLQAERLI